MKLACGIDIGGSGVKGALVDLTTGTYSGESVLIKTPSPATPDAVAQVCGQVLETLGVTPEIPVGITFPAPIVHGRVPFMATLDPSWAGMDAAGLGEAIYGAARGVPGVVIVTTLGTGIGSAIINDGILLPNSELGHLEIDGHDAETQASAGQKTVQNLDWVTWAGRLQRYYSHVEMLFSPDLFVIGGGVSANHEKFLPLLNLRTPVAPAILRNTAGIVGAAFEAARESRA